GGAGAAADVEVAPGAAARRAAPAEAPQEPPRPEPREEPGVLVAEPRVAEARRERPAHGADARRPPRERHARRRLLMARVVIGVARGEVRVADARSAVVQTRSARSPPQSAHGASTVGSVSISRRSLPAGARRGPS